MQSVYTCSCIVMQPYATVIQYTVGLLVLASSLDPRPLFLEEMACIRLSAHVLTISLIPDNNVYAQ